MISPIDICNQALAHLGDRRIHRIDEDAQETDAIVRYCAEYYEQTKQEVLAAHRWTFAKKAVALTRSVGDAIFRYNYSHVLPTDMMRFLEILEAEVVTPAVDYVAPVAASGSLTAPNEVFSGNPGASPAKILTVGGQDINIVYEPYLGAIENTISVDVGTIFSISQEDFLESSKEMINGEGSSVTGVAFHNVTFSTPVTASTSKDESGLPSEHTYTLTVTSDEVGEGGNSIDTLSSPPAKSWDANTLTGGVDEVVAVDTVYAYNRKVDKFKIVGNKVWSNVEDLGLFYISNLDDPDQWTPHFRACVARKLASYLAGPVADNPGEAQRLLDMYERVDLPNAQFYDAVQDASGENSDMETRVADSPLLRSRYREGYTLGNSSDEPITYP